MHWPGVYPVGVVVMTCTHSRETVTVMTSQCEICGRVHSERVATVAQAPAKLIRQGLVDADGVIEVMWLDGPDAEYLRGIQRCEHPNVKESKCRASGKAYKRCADCGRKWSKV